MFPTGNNGVGFDSGVQHETAGTLPFGNIDVAVSPRTWPVAAEIPPERRSLRSQKSEARRDRRQSVDLRGLSASRSPP
jgi:hypothetical protein